MNLELFTLAELQQFRQQAYTLRPLMPMPRVNLLVSEIVKDIEAEIAKRGSSYPPPL